MQTPQLVKCPLVDKYIMQTPQVLNCFLVDKQMMHKHQNFEIASLVTKIMHTVLF